MITAELVIACLVVLFVKAPDFYPDPRLQPVPDAALQAARETAYGSSVASLRTAALAALVGLAALGTLAVNAINSRLSVLELRNNQEVARATLRRTDEDARESRRQAAEDARESRRLTAHGQLIDRYAQAVELLGSNNLTARAGGSYALQQLALGAAAEPDDRNAVREVLTAFVRTAAASRTPAPDSPRPVGTTTPASTSAWPPVDVRAALTVLGRLYKPLEPRADLRGADFTGGDLTGADLRGADLAGTTLIGTTLAGTLIAGASLRGANLLGASFVSDEQLATADGDQHAVLPTDLHIRPSHWTNG